MLGPLRKRPPPLRVAGGADQMGAGADEPAQGSSLELHEALALKRGEQAMRRRWSQAGAANDFRKRHAALVLGNASENRQGPQHGLDATMSDRNVTIFTKFRRMTERQPRCFSSDTAKMVLDCFQSRHRFSLPLFCGCFLVMLPFLLYVQYIIWIG